MQIAARTFLAIFTGPGVKSIKDFSELVWLGYDIESFDKLSMLISNASRDLSSLPIIGFSTLLLSALKIVTGKILFLITTPFYNFII